MRLSLVLLLVLLLLVLLLLVSCNESPTNPDIDPVANPVTGRWSGAIRDVACGDGTLTMDIQQFQTQYGNFFYGTFTRTFPGNGTGCNGSASVVNGSIGEREVRFILTNTPPYFSSCDWDVVGTRTSVNTITAVHTRVCAGSRGGMSLARE